MASYLPALYTVARAVIASACPEVVANGIYEAEHADRIPWEEYNLPYAVILVESMTQSLDYSGINDVYDVSLEVFYVCEVGGPVSPIRDALERIRDAFNTADQMLIQVQRIRELSWSDSSEVNALFASKNMPHRAGRIDISVIAGGKVWNPT